MDAYETCITIWHWPDHPRWFEEGVRASLRHAKSAGFTHINWNADAGSSYLLSQSEIALTAQMIRDAGLKVHSVHAAHGRNPISEVRWKRGPDVGRETRKDFLSPVDWQRQSGVELIQNRVDLAAALGAPNIVLHVELTMDDFSDKAAEDGFFAPLEASFDDLMPYCKERDVKIAVENLMIGTPEIWHRFYARLFDRWPADFVGLCYDSGHWEIVEPGGVSLLDAFGDRLIATHLHDNFGATDDHLLPHDGRLDWNRITAAIAATRYDPPLTFETPFDRYALSENAFMHRAYGIAQMLARQVADQKS